VTNQLKSREEQNQFGCRHSSAQNKIGHGKVMAMRWNYSYEGTINMHKQMKNILWVGIMILLVSACGPLQTTPAAVDTAEPLVTPISAESMPTTAMANGSDAGKFSNYIGLSYPPLPADLTEGFSMMIQDSDDHGLWLVSDDEGRMLWLSKLTHHDLDGNAYWVVMDVLDLSNVESGAVLIPDGCRLNGEADNEIIVAAKDEKSLLTWRANTALNYLKSFPQRVLNVTQIRE
jgi:hypothetical protein